MLFKNVQSQNTEKIYVMSLKEYKKFLRTCFLFKKYAAFSILKHYKGFTYSNVFEYISTFMMRDVLKMLCIHPSCQLFYL